MLASLGYTLDLQVLVLEYCIVPAMAELKVRSLK